MISWRLSITNYTTTQATVIEESYTRLRTVNLMKFFKHITILSPAPESPWGSKAFGRVAIINNAPRVIFSTNFAVSMSVQTASRRESASQEEEDDEEFIKESTKLAKSFTEFFISSQAISGREYLEY